MAPSNSSTAAIFIKLQKMVLTFKSVRKSWSEKLISFYSGTVYFRLDSKAGIVLNLWPFTRTWLALDFVTLAPKLPPNTFLSLYIVLQYIFFHKSRLVKPIHMNISRKETRTTYSAITKPSLNFPTALCLLFPEFCHLFRQMTSIWSTS